MRAVVKAALAFALMSGALAHAEQELPVYPGTIHTRIGTDLVIAGEYYRLAYFLTDDPIPQVAQYFASHWKRLGIPTVVDGDGKEEMIVSAFYTREGLQRAVILRVHQGRTLGFSVLRDLWLQQEASAHQEPPYENALFATHISDRDERINGEYTTAILEGSLDFAANQVEGRMARDGFNRTSMKKTKIQGKHNWVMEFERGKERVIATLVEVEAGLTAVNENRSNRRRAVKP